MGALAVLLRAPTIVSRMFDPDEAAIGVQAMVLRSGGTLYVDIFDRKPPLPPLLYSWSFALTDSNDLRPLRVLVTLALVVASVLVALDARRRWGSTHGWWAGVLFATASMALYPVDAGAANYAHFALLPATAALLWSRRAGWPYAAAAGAALGVAVLCRQSWILATPAAAVSAYLAGRWRQVLVLVPCAVLVVLTTGFYAPLGAFWEWNFANSPGFVFAPTELGASLRRGVSATLGFAALHLVLVGCAAAALRRWRRRDQIDLWMWTLTGAAAVTAGLRFFGHYWLQVVPPLVLLATPYAARLGGRLRAGAIGVLALTAAITFSMLFVPGSFRDRPAAGRVATYVAANSTPADRVLVWGSFPEVLLRADRLPAGRLVHSDFVTGKSGGRDDPQQTLADAAPGARELFLADLRARPPLLVLDTSGVPDLHYVNYPMSVIPGLDEFVREGYRVVDVVEGITVWRRSGR